MALKFYLLSTASFLIFPFLGFITGMKIFYEFMIRNFGNPKVGEEVLGYAFYTAAFSIFCFFVGISVSLIIIHKLGKRWGSRLNFGGHPVLKLTFLSFLTFLGLLFLLLLFYPSK